MKCAHINKNTRLCL